MDILAVKYITLAQWLILIPLLTVILFTIQWKWYQRKNREILKVAAKLPIPVPCNIILGTWYKPKSYQFIPSFRGEDFTNQIKGAMKVAAEKQYSLFCLWAGPIPQIFVQKPQDAQTILTSSRSLQKGPEYEFAKFVLRDGLLTAPVTKWKISRRYMNPVFHHQNLNNLTAVFNQSSRHLVKDMAFHVSGESFDVFQPLFTASIISICSILFGLKNQSKMGTNDFQLGASVSRRIAQYVGERTYVPWLWSDRLFNFIYKKKLEELEKSWTLFISQPMKLLENEDIKSVPEAYSKIIQEHNIFSDIDMHAEMKTILATGSDTTAIGLSSCLVLLGTHPDIQEKLYNEITCLLGSEDQDVAVEDLNALPYLDQVIKETLRICTVVMGFKRTFSEEIKLSEYTIPKGGSVYVSVIGLHFDPKVYPDPYVFNPEHFTPENVAKRHPYSYLPFSGGPRNCIGKQYAMISMKTMLAHILRAYKISANENLLDLRYIFTVSLKSIDGYMISLESRNK